MAIRILALTLTILFASFSAQILMADEITVSREYVIQASSAVEAKLGITQKFHIPFLQGESPLTENNNVKIALTAEITPISVDGVIDVVWTPIAFLEFSTGSKIGSGWNIRVFDSNIYGIGLNRDRNDGSGYAEHNGKAFDGMLWKTLVGGAFQFDLAAIFPGDWNHVIMRTYHELNYAGYTRAKKHESWYMENKGENVNGFNYYGNLVLGYQMPLFLNMIALMAEADLFLYNTPGRSAWGDDRIHWTFSGICNFTVSERMDLAVITQFRTVRNYHENNWEDLYYRNRTLNKSNPTSLEFYRIATLASYKF